MKIKQVVVDIVVSHYTLTIMWIIIILYHGVEPIGPII
jgi:hypothetical protein